MLFLATSSAISHAGHQFSQSGDILDLRTLILENTAIERRVKLAKAWALLEARFQVHSASGCAILSGAVAHDVAPVILIGSCIILHALIVGLSFNAPVDSAGISEIRSLCQKNQSSNCNSGSAGFGPQDA
jgi:hypothetical protein